MNNPIVEIGRYSLPIESVAGICLRERGRLARLWIKLTGRIPAPEYDVLLVGGITLRFTEEEKAKLDEELALHKAVMEVMGMIGAVQANQRAR